MSFVSASTKEIVLRTSKFSPLQKTYHLIYQIGLKFILFRLKKLSEISSVCATGVTKEDRGLPGSSDIDLIIVTKNISPNLEYEIWLKIQKIYQSSKQIFPFLNGLNILSQKELEAHYKIRSIRQPASIRRKTYVVSGKVINIAPSSNKLKISDYFWLIKNDLRNINDYAFTMGAWKHSRYLVNHITKGLISHIKKIDGGNNQPSLNTLRDHCSDIVTNNYFVKKPLNNTSSLWAMSLKEMGRVGRSSNSLPDISKKQERPRWKLRLSSQYYPPSSQSQTIATLEPFIEGLKTLPGVEHVILSSNYGSNFQYDTLILVNDLLELKELQNTLKNIILFYYREKKNWTHNHLQMPFVIANSYFDTYYRHCCEPMELFYMMRYGKFLLVSEKNMCMTIDEVLNKVNNFSLFEYANAFVDGTPLGWNCFLLFNASLEKNDWTSTLQGLDFIFGNIPAKRVTLETGIISLTPEETHTHYTQIYKHEPETTCYNEIYNKIYVNYPDKTLMPELRKQKQSIFMLLRKNIESIINMIPKELIDSDQTTPEKYKHA